MLTRRTINILINTTLPQKIQITRMSNRIQQNTSPFIRNRFHSLIPNRQVTQRFKRQNRFISSSPLSIFNIIPVKRIRRSHRPNHTLSRHTSHTLITNTNSRITLPITKSHPILHLNQLTVYSKLRYLHGPTNVSTRGNIPSTTLHNLKHLDQPTTFY